jgi:hypothetical protein
MMLLVVIQTVPEEMTAPQSLFTPVLPPEGNFSDAPGLSVQMGT